MSTNTLVDWVAVDPLFRICVIVESSLWIFVFLFFCLCLCLIWCRCRCRCCRTRAALYSPTCTEEKATDESPDPESIRPESRVTVKSHTSARTKKIVLIGGAVIIAYFLMILVMIASVPFLMPQLLYIPEPCDNQAWCRYVPGAINLFATTGSGNNISIRVFPANQSGPFYDSHLNVMYSNPNAGYTPREPFVYETLASYGLRVYAWDYPGYMLSTGSPNHDSVMAAAETVLGVVAADVGVDRRDVVLAGRSLGGAVSMALADLVNSRALILLNALDSLELLLNDCCPMSGWASGLHYRKEFNAVDLMPRFRGCLFQYAATEDTVVYFQRQRNIFFEYSKNKNKRCSVFVKGNHLGHNDNQWEESPFIRAFNLFLNRLDS